MIKSIITHTLVAYLAVGIVCALIMGSVIPLSFVGKSFYAVTWPQQIYCAVKANECDPLLGNLPPTALGWMFTNG